MTEKDTEIEAVKNDEKSRRARLEQVNYQLFSEELINAGHESGMDIHKGGNSPQ